MTRDEFCNKWIDDLTGLLVAAFAEASARPLCGDGGKSDADHTANGRFMMRQLRRAKELVGRMYDDAAPKADPVANGKRVPS